MYIWPCYGANHAAWVHMHGHDSVMIGLHLPLTAMLIVTYAISTQLGKSICNELHYCSYIMWTFK